MTSPFNWNNGQPSIFRGDKAFTANKHGENPSQTASRAVQEYEVKTGRSRGTVYGISKKSDAAAEEFTRLTQIRTAKRRAKIRKG